MSKKNMRYCKQFHCHIMKDRVCCADCPKVTKCDNHCLNHPSECRLVDNAYKPKKEKK